MNRRNFLKSLIVIAAAPAIVKAENIMKIYVPKIVQPFHIDRSGTIIYTGAKDKLYTIKEFYSFLSDELDKPENMTIESPILVTNNFLHLSKDLHLGNSHLNLKGGCIENGSRFWGTVNSIIGV